MQLRFLVCTALLAVASTCQAAVIHGSNLVVNGDAESGLAGWTGYEGYDMIQAVDYGNNWVLPTQPGPAARGTKMFAGLGQYAVGVQTLDFGTTTTQGLSYTLSGWLGGWTSQDDNALFHVQFLDELDNEVGNAGIGPVMASDRANQTGLYYRALEGVMPAGTRKLSFWLSMERLVSGDNDGYADNLSFVLEAPPVNKVPAPGTVPAGLLGLCMLGWMRRRGHPIRMR